MCSGLLLFWKWRELTRLQKALQVYWADKLLPVVRPPGNDAQQLLGYNNTQRVRQVGFINSGDEEWAAWLQNKHEKQDNAWVLTSDFIILHHHHRNAAAIARCRACHRGINRRDLKLSVHENRKNECKAWRFNRGKRKCNRTGEKGLETENEKGRVSFRMYETGSFCWSVSALVPRRSG